MVWVIAFGELFFGGLWCVVWGYGGMRTHFSLLNPFFVGFRAPSFTFFHRLFGECPMVCVWEGGLQVVRESVWVCHS